MIAAASFFGAADEVRLLFVRGELHSDDATDMCLAIGNFGSSDAGMFEKLNEVRDATFVFARGANRPTVIYLAALLGYGYS